MLLLSMSASSLFCLSLTMATKFAYRCKILVIKMAVFKRTNAGCHPLQQQ